MFNGCITALATPFTPQHKLDIAGLKHLISYQQKHGVKNFVACGSTGEAATLSDDEYAEVIKTTKSCAQGEKVIAGVNSSSTQKAVQMALLAKASGADAVLLVAPPYNKPPQSGIIEHFRAVKKAVALPIIAYNIPGRVAVSISPASLQTLATEGTIVAIKESSGALDTQLDTAAACGTKAPLLAGDDSFVLALLACGAAGVISACANVAPREFVGLCIAWQNGDSATAREIQFKLLPLIRALFVETNPIPVKWMLQRLGIIESDAVRLPLVPLQRSSIDLLEGCMTRLDWLKQTR